MTTTAWIQDRYDNDRKTVVVHDDEYLSLRAKLTFQLIERWGLVAAMPDGEDSSGRAKLRLPTSQELVTRSCEISELLFDECGRRNWLIKGPSAEELKQKIDDDSHKTRR